MFIEYRQHICSEYGRGLETVICHPDNHGKVLAASLHIDAALCMVGSVI